MGAGGDHRGRSARDATLRRWRGSARRSRRGRNSGCQATLRAGPPQHPGPVLGIGPDRHSPNGAWWKHDRAESLHSCSSARQAGLESALLLVLERELQLRAVGDRSAFLEVNVLLKDFSNPEIADRLSGSPDRLRCRVFPRCAARPDNLGHPVHAHDCLLREPPARAVPGPAVRIRPQAGPGPRNLSCTPRPEPGTALRQRPGPQLGRVWPRCAAITTKELTMHASAAASAQLLRVSAGATRCRRAPR